MRGLGRGGLGRVMGWGRLLGSGGGNVVVAKAVVGEAESKLKGVPLRIWPLNPTANGRHVGANRANAVVPRAPHLLQAAGAFGLLKGARSQELN